MSEVKELPKGWKHLPLGEVLKVSSGKGINVNSLKGGKYAVYGGNGISGYHSEYLIEEPKLIIGRVGAKCGVTYVTKPKSWISDNALIVEPLIQDFDLKFFQLKLGFEDLNKLSVSTAQPVISGSKIYAYSISLPPLQTQQAIVSKIEELFSEVDKGIETLRTAQQQLKTYRQSVLKWAFEGKLTEEWRKKNTKKVKGAVPRAGIEPSDLPEGWEWVKLTDLVPKDKHSLKAGPFGSSLKKEHYVSKGYKVYGQEQVISGDPYFGDYYIDKEKYTELFTNRIKPFDILISLVGTVGKVLILPANCEEGIINPRLIKVSLDRNVYLSSFFKYYFESSKVKSFYSGETRGTTMDVLNLGIIKTIDFPLCSIQEQQAIVEEIESRLSVADKMEESIATSLQQAEALKQSILKMAFEGRLVSEVEVVREKAITKPSKKSKIIKLPVEVYPRIKEGIAATDLHAGIIAMIVDLHEKHPEHLINLTHVKCEKIAHLVEAKLGISLGRMPVKDAAGPDDFPHLKKVEHRANKCNWLKVIKQDIGYTYQSKSGASKIITKVETVLGASELNQVKSLMNEFLKFDLERSEVIATIYAGWNNLLILGQQPTDEEIVFESRENWSKRKLLIERGNFFKALIWMRKHGYIPEGKGSLVLKKSEIQKIKK